MQPSKINEVFFVPRTLKLSFIALAALLAACAAEPEQKDAAYCCDTRSASAEITSIDDTTREIGLLTEDGEEITVPASDQVRNFDQLEVGDKVNFTLTEAVAVQMASEDERGQQFTSVATGRAVPGEKPGLAVGSLTEQVVEFISYDGATGTAMFINADGITQTVTVRPELREFAKARKKGDLIGATIERSFAISVVPQE